MAVDRARATALAALAAVRRRDAYANLVLPGLLDRRGLAGRDAALATDLTYGTLRGLGTYDRVLEACTQRPLRAARPEVLDALRLGTHQLLVAGVPPHAAVSTTVDLVTARSGSGAARFTNAVLRHVASADLDEWAHRLAPPELDLLDHLAMRCAASRQRAPPRDRGCLARALQPRRAREGGGSARGMGSHSGCAAGR